MNYEYYEIIAANLFDINPESLWMRSREDKVKLPRQFCMKYRIDIEGLSQSKAGGRYMKNHATARSGSIKIDNYIEFNDKLGILYLQFLDKCKIEKQRIDLNRMEGKKQLLRNIESMGWYDYVNTIVEPMSTLTELIYKNDNEDMIREYIKVVEEKLNELKYLYKLEYEPQNV